MNEYQCHVCDSTWSAHWMAVACCSTEKQRRLDEARPNLRDEVEALFMAEDESVVARAWNGALTQVLALLAPNRRAPPPSDTVRDEVREKE